jgi:hypothetical protein
VPEEPARKRAQKAREEGKAPTTQAGEFIREEMHQIGKKRGPRSPQQAIAIGLSEARRAGIDVKPPAANRSSAATRKKAQKDYEKGQAKRAAKKAPAKSKKTARPKSARKSAAK